MLQMRKENAQPTRINAAAGVYERIGQLVGTVVGTVKPQFAAEAHHLDRLGNDWMRPGS